MGWYDLEVGVYGTSSPGEASRQWICVPFPSQGGSHYPDSLKPLWLADAHFVVPRGGNGFVVGRRMPPRSDTVLARSGWTQVRLDMEPSGSFYDVRTGANVRSAPYARIIQGQIDAFGAQKGAPLRDTREIGQEAKVPILGPRREHWRGELGGLNYAVPTRVAEAEGVAWVFAIFPGAVVVDGSDDWNAPDYVRPHVLAQRWGLVPLAWWHTGVSGKSPSGMVLTEVQYERFKRAYESDYGCGPEEVTAVGIPMSSKRCECWAGGGLTVYR